MPQRLEPVSVELERLRQHLTCDDDRLLVDFLVATGLRVSELMGLNWSSVDVATCRVKIEQRLYRGMDAPGTELKRRGAS